MPSTVTIESLVGYKIPRGAWFGITGHLATSTHLSALRCQFRWSTQHLLAVYSQGFGILKFFWGVDSSAARPGRAALENSRTGRYLAGSIAATGDWCFRWCRAARDSADRRSTPDR